LIEKSEKRKTATEAEEVREILGAVSTEIPALIKSIIGSVFSEEAGKSMGRAAAAFYKELKDGGMPDDVAVEMTENYMGVFTSLGDILKRTGYKGKGFISTEKEEEVERETEKVIKEKVEEKLREKEEQE
jgi:hypothetical protein